MRQNSYLLARGIMHGAPEPYDGRNTTHFRKNFELYLQNCLENYQSLP